MCKAHLKQPLLTKVLHVYYIKNSLDIEMDHL